MPTPLNRRDILRLAGLGAIAAGASAVGCAGNKGDASPAPGVAAKPKERTRVLRVAHLTDTHVQPELRAGQGMAACLAHAQAQPDRPNLILTGGDHVMDSFDADDARTRTQWDVFQRVWRDNCGIPAQSCLGNHDCWGWNKAKSKTKGDEPNWGKARSVEALKMPGRYYSFDNSGWRFVVLDSTFPSGDGYIARLDDEQFEWLKGILAATPKTTPVFILSHMPILTATVLVENKDDIPAERKLSASRMHVDASRLVRLFRKHPNVRLCVSGHIHLNDRLDFHGTSYICAGAVSGSWWKGHNDDCVEGYSLFDLYDDGMFEYAYVDYGWTAEKPA